MSTISLIVHGGAWDIPDDLVQPHRDGLLAAVRAGWAVLKAGGKAVDAVEKAIMAMENDETFDAGKGSFLNLTGHVELDASIMDGRTMKAGAVAAVQNVPNPIRLARKIMQDSEHVLLVGIGASRFAKEKKIPTCSQDHLITARELERWRQGQGEGTSSKHAFVRKGHDTVGAVALDKSGNLVAGTSTGGTPNKFPGRVGDSPLIGCGTYADSAVGAVSATGWGESLIKVVMAKTVADLIERFDFDAGKAARQGITILEKKVKGYGGVIAISKTGQTGIAFNTPRMARAWMTAKMKAPIVEV